VNGAPLASPPLEARKADVLGRRYVDLPFFMASPDLLNTQSLVSLLVPLGFISFFALIRLVDR